MAAPFARNAAPRRQIRDAALARGAHRGANTTTVPFHCEPMVPFATWHARFGDDRR